MNSWSESQFVQKLVSLRDRWFPKTVIEVTGSGFQYSAFADGHWSQVEELPETQAFVAQNILLVPDAFTFFKLRQFPVESVSRQTLNEAVELDLARWSPWQEGIEFYYWPKRHGNNWQVAVWVWQIADLEKVKGDLESAPTHVMPALAWKIASLEHDNKNFIHIDDNGDGSWTYTEILDEFSSLRVANVRNETDARRFKATTGSDVLPVYVSDEVDVASLHWEEQSELSVSRYATPVFSALAAARQPGIQDWADPFTWAKPIGGLMSLYILWLLGNGLVLFKQGEEILEYSKTASSVSIEVLDARAEVERINVALESIDRIRAEQLRLESVLASLSVALPRNAWLEHIEYRDDDGGWLEITGKSQASSSLAAILEQIPEVAQATFLNDIRKDRDGMEPFKIRLKLAFGDSNG